MSCPTSRALLLSFASGASFACLTPACGGIADLGDVRPDAAAESSSQSSSAPDGSSSNPPDSHTSSAPDGPTSSAPDGSASTLPDSTATTAPTSALLYCPYTSGTGAPNTWSWSSPSWTLQTSSTQPTSRVDSAMAWDGHEIILFGGTDTSTNDVLSDTWAWSGGVWTELHPATAPTARSFHTLATLGDSLVLFGGWSGTANLGDTWVWDGTNWSKASPTTSPPARDFAQAATVGGLAYLFGGGIGTPSSGLPNSTYLNDTWAWDGQDWSSVTTTTGLTGQWSFGMTAFAGKLVIFQQNEDNTQAPVSSFLLEASGWQATASTYPMSSFAGSSAAGVGPEVVFAGRTLDTIAWNGTTWTDVGAGPNLDSCDDGLMMAPMP